MTSAPRSNLRVVFDTNIYFSAFTHQGQPFQIWRKAIESRFTLIVSPAIMRELAGVLRVKMDWQESEIRAHLKLLAKVAEIISPSITLHVS